MWSRKTRVGTFFIMKKGDRYHVIFDNESLGGYTTPQEAAWSIAGGHAFSCAGGVDTSTLGIPEDVREWTIVRR